MDKKESELPSEFLSTVLDNLPVALFGKDANNDYRFCVWNKTAEKFWGLTNSDIIGKSDYDFFPKAQSDFFRKKDSETLANGIVVTIEEEPITLPNGEFKLLRTTKTPISGRYLIGISEDITEKRQMEKLLEFSRKLDHFLVVCDDENEVFSESLKEMRVFLNADLAAFWRVDSPDGDFILTYQDRSAPLVAGSSEVIPEFVQMKRDRKDFYFNELSSNRSASWYVLSESNNSIVAIKFREMGAESAIGIPVYAKGELVGVIEILSKSKIHHHNSLLKELTGVAGRIGQVIERIHLKASMVRSTRMASLGEMAGGIAHEINNPLAIIMGKTGQIRKMIEKLSEPQKVLLELDKIELTAHRIVKIISGLRTFSRDAKNDPMTIVGLKDIVTETLDYCQERFKNKGVDLSVSKIPEVQLECRPAQISQVILNLLNNSFDAVESQKDKSIGINLVSQNDKLEIQVWDSGTRISESILTKLMQPFFTTKQVGKGTGLGLSISKGIAEDHQGSLTYDRNSLKTQFILSVPLRQIKTKKT